MTVQGLLLLLVYMSTSSAQLIGSRGVFTLKEGVEYRDPETVQASETVANFAREFQEEDDDIAERRSRVNDFRPRHLEISPKFQTQVLDNVKGRPLIANEIFDFLESRFVEPSNELQFNKFLDEIEIERATSAIRLLPGEGLPPTPRPATRAPNRLVNLQRPSLGSEESVRSQNSQFATVFGPPTGAVDNFRTPEGSRFNPPPINQLETNQLAENFQDSGLNFPAPQPNLLFSKEQQQSANDQHVIRPFVNLNAGTRFLSGPEPLSVSGPGSGFNRPGNGGIGLSRGPVGPSVGNFHGPVGPSEGIASGPVGPNVHVSSLPVQHGFDGTFHQGASFSSRPHAIELSSGKLPVVSSLPPSHLSGGSFHQNVDVVGDHNGALSGGPLLPLSSLDPAILSLNHRDGFSNVPSQVSFSSSGPEFFQGPVLSSGVPQNAFGLGFPGLNGEPHQGFSSGPHRFSSSQGSGFSGLAPSHSLSEGPHHSLSIQHLH